MKYTIVYSSRTGNTEKVALAIREALPAEDCVYFGPPEGCKKPEGLVFAGFWTDKGGCDGESAGFFPLLAGRRAALFGTAGFGGSADYFDGILARVKALLPKDCSVAGTFLCQGAMPDHVRERYEAMRERSPGETGLEAMLANFDRARTHPDQEDLRRAAQFAAAVLTGEAG